MNVNKYESWKVRSNQEILKRKTKGYKSVTEVINSKPNPSLEKWKKELGEDVANYEMKRCSKRGAKVHSMISEYLYSNFKHHFSSSERMIPNSHLSDNVLANGLFLNMLGYLELLKDIVFVEVPLYSDIYKIHGIVDCVATFECGGEDDYKAIIEFKTSNSYKHSISKNYGIQLTAYALMYNEMFDENIEDILLINASEDESCTAIRRKVKDFIPSFNEYFSN
tara:strand:- start:36 stop:704 length:669 start_codon:yes stop_codon:yes gene_type:complete